MVINKKKRSAREKRILIASLVIAATIVAGSTFAWFSSKDEVTNRLSASANYNVAIGETFQPPTNLAPGQAVNKDIVAVNTGDVDAFVRMWFDGSMKFMKQNGAGTAESAKYTEGTGWNISSEGNDDTYKKVEDANLRNLGLTRIDAEGNLYKTLSKTKTVSVNLTPNPDEAENLPGTFSEVQAMQSGVLAYAPNGAKFAYVLQHDTELEVLTDSDNEVYTKGIVPKGTLVIAGGNQVSGVNPNTHIVTPAAGVPITDVSGVVRDASAGTVAIKSPALNDDAFAPVNIEFESFVPMSKGLYLFLRNETQAAQVANDPEFSGYYMTEDATAALDGTPAAFDNVEFFALNTNTAGTNRSDYTVKGAAEASADAPILVTGGSAVASVKPTENLELYTAKYADSAVTTDDDAWSWTVTAPNNDGTATLIGTYNGANENLAENEQIVAEIFLANVGTGKQQWTALKADGTKPTFYYNDDVEAGGNSSKLVDSVRVYTTGKNGSKFLSFDFDLNAHLESVQVTIDDQENETADAVEGGWAATEGENNVAATSATAAHDDKEITNITWSAT